MKTKTKTTHYLIYSIAASVLLLTAQINLAGSATWLSSPQDSAWENANNWTPGGPPNGPSDVATFAQSSQTNVNISTSEEVNSIVFTPGSASFNLSISSELTISGTGATNNSSVLQRFDCGYDVEGFLVGGGVLVFNNTSTAASAHMSIDNESFWQASYTFFNDSSSAAGASIYNAASPGIFIAPGQPGATIFHGTSTAGHAGIGNAGGFGAGHDTSAAGGYTEFYDSSTADSATLVADWGGTGGGLILFNDAATAGNAIIIANGNPSGEGAGGAIIFYDSSTGGTARVEVFDNGDLDIRDHQSGVTVGSIEGSGNVFLAANNLTVGTNNISTSFSGVISGSGSLAKIGSGVLTLQTNHCIADTVGLTLVTGSTIKLDFTGPSDAIASLKVNGVSQRSGTYGGPLSGAPNILPEFAGLGTVHVGPIPILRNISSRAFVQTGGNVIIGGFIVQGAEPKRVIIRAIGPELTHYGVPNPLGNPTLELHDGTGALIASNDNWQHTIIGGIITENQVADIMATRLEPQDPSESAIIAELPAGNYTAIVRGVNNTTGAALVEVYDLSPGNDSFLSNISTRSFVQTHDNVMIGGFIVAGTGPKRVIVRAIGPELTQYGVPNALLNPTLELHDHTGALIASNDNWQHTIVGGIITSDQTLAIRNSSRAPGDNRESAIVAELPAGNYTAIVRGVNNSTGVALVEVYNLDQ